MDDEISSLKSQVAQLEAQAKECFHMKLQNDVMGRKISKLQTEITLKQRKLRKLKSKSSEYRKNISYSNRSINKMEEHLKKVWSLLLVFADKLRRNDLLTFGERMEIHNEYGEWLTLMLSVNHRSAEQFYKVLKDLPINIFEILNNLMGNTQNSNSQMHASNVTEEQSSISVNSTGELSSGFSPTSPQSFISPESICDEESSRNGDITASQAVSVEDFVKSDYALDEELRKLNAVISNSEQAEVASEISSFKLSKDLSDTEEYDMKIPDLVTDRQCTEKTTDDQEIIKTESSTPNNLANNTSSLQMPHNETCILDPDNINTSLSNLNTDFKDINIVSKDENVNFNTKTNEPSPDFSNILSSSSKISSIIAPQTKPLKKRISKLDKFKQKIIKGNKFHKTTNRSQQSLQKVNPCPRAKKPEIPFLSTPISLELNSKPKEKPQSKNESVKLLNKRTITLPGPPMKIPRKSQPEADLKSQDDSNSMQKLSFCTDYVPRSKDSDSSVIQLAKKPKLVLKNETSDVAPVRIRGRTVINRGRLKIKKEKVKNNETLVNQDSAEVEQGCNNKLASDQVSDSNFLPTIAPKKIRIQHKKVPTKKPFKCNNTNRDGAELCKDSSTVQTHIDIASNNLTNNENSGTNVLEDLLKKAELSKKSSVLKNSTLNKYLKYKGRKRSGGSLSFSYFNKHKKMSKFRKHHSIILYSKRSSKVMTKLKNTKAKEDAMKTIKTSSGQGLQVVDVNKTSVETKCSTLSNSVDISASYNITSKTFIENYSSQPAVSSNSSCKTSLITDEDIPDNVKSDDFLINSTFKSNLEMTEDKDHDLSPVLAKKLISSPKEEMDNSSDESDCDMPLVIDENLDDDQQSEEKNELQDQNFEVEHPKLEYLYEPLQNESKNELCKDVRKDNTENNSTNNGLIIDGSLCINGNLDGGNHCRNVEEISKKSQANKNINTGNDSSSKANVHQLTDYEARKQNSNINVPNSLNISKGNKISTPTITSAETSITTSNVESNFVLNEASLKNAYVINNDQTCDLVDKIISESKKAEPLPSFTKNNAQRKSPKAPSSLNKKTKKNLFAPNKKGLNHDKNVPSKSDIDKFFEEFQNIAFSEENFKQNIKLLSNFLLNPTNFPDNSVILLHIMKYLNTCKNNPLLLFSTSGDSSVLFPLDEKCIVAVFLLVESKKKQHLDGLVKYVIEGIYSIVTSYKKSLSLFGLASLCRVLTAICKEKEDNLKPVLLCGDLLKRQHGFAPYLIASVASIWKELFQIDSSMPAEECLFHSCVLYGATQRNSKRLLDFFWKSSLEFISKHFTALPLRDVKSAIKMLQQILQDRCEDESWDNQYLSSALIILASYETWDWIERYLMVEYIVPNMKKYGTQSLNQNAFDLFCNMYVETFLLSPGNPLDSFLTSFVISKSEGAPFVQAVAALALMRFVLKKNRKLPSFLNDWFEHNKDNAEVIKIKSYYETLKLYVNHYQNSLNISKEH